MVYKILTMVLFPVAVIFSSCHRNCHVEEEYSDRVRVVSDDSVITAYWWDTHEGGTAPQIDAVVYFKTESGEVKVEHNPLMWLVDTDYYDHSVIEKIIHLEDEYGEKVYFFFLFSKESSTLFTHHIVAFTIDGDRLKPNDKWKMVIPLKSYEKNRFSSYSPSLPENALIYWI